MGKQKDKLPTVKRATESSQDSALHSSAGAQQSDRRPGNYRPYTPQQMARINQANIEFRNKQKENFEKERKREKELNRQ